MAIDVSITVAGSRVTDMPDMNVTRSLSDNNSVSSFTANLNNYAGYNTSKYSIGQEVQVFARLNGSSWTNEGSGAVYYGSGIIFTGIIEDIGFDGEGIRERMQLTGKDYSCRLLDRNVEPEIYAGLAPGSIVKDIISKYTNDITVNNVSIAGGSISRIKFNQMPVFDAIRQLAGFNNYNFYVDEQKDLHFESANGSDSGYTFNDTNVIRGDFKSQRDTVYNQVWVYGDRYLDAFKETATGLFPAGSEFTLNWNPHNMQVTVSGAIIQPGGVYQMVATAGSNVRYLVNYEDKKIIFTSGTICGDNIPFSGNAIIFDYQRLLPIVKVGDDESSKAQYGTKVKSIVDKSIKDPNTAMLIMKTELNKSSQPIKEGNILADGVTSIVPGRTCTVNLPYHDVNNQSYQVIEADYKINKEDCLHDHIMTLKLNKKLPDITDSIKEMMLQLKKIQAQDISDSDTLTRYQMGIGSFSIRQSGCVIRTRSVSTFGFILGNSSYGILGTSVLGPNTYGPYSIAWSGNYY